MRENIHRTKIFYPKPGFDSELMSILFQHESWGTSPIRGTTNRQIFQQIFSIFQMLENIRSARIEGNHTTIADFIDTKIQGNLTFSPSLQEIKNIEEASHFIEQNENTPINKSFVSELHKIVTQNLEAKNGEGDKTPGIYRKTDVKIQQSAHIPPPHYLVEEYMTELFDEIQKDTLPQYSLLKIALMHHRFVWIHPFGNGNGRTGRLLTYAMLNKSYPFTAWSMNPNSIFAKDRNTYYDMLARADTYTEEGLLEWCEYVGKGLHENIEKIGVFANKTQLISELFIPMITHACAVKSITPLQKDILIQTVKKQVIQNSDLLGFFPQKSAQALISQEIRKLLDMNMLIHEGGSKRRYIISFEKGPLLRSMIAILRKKGFIADDE